MRKVHVLVALGGLLGGAAAQVAGCHDYVAELYDPLTDPRLASSTTSGTGGHDSGPPPGCIPSENTGAVGDSCGVFVSSSLGADGVEAGAKGKPFKSLGAALAAAKAKGKPVYACGEAFSESVAIDASAVLYGGLDCGNGWVYAASKKTQLTAEAEAIPLVVSKAETSAEVYDFGITSATATQAGGSSIAVLVAQAAASFTRCEVTAGDGATGAVGVPFTGAAAVGNDGKDGGAACSASFVPPGLSVTSTCDASSVGGSGGIGDIVSGGNASDGQPGVTLNGGKGEGSAICTAGTKGDDGTPGGAGLGATGTGSLSAGGYTGVTGGDGKSGVVAQGGGGGGGAKGGAASGKCASATSAGGASGGSGSSGGCGGLGGKGGTAGGASIAIASINATLSFVSVTVKVGRGGDGGDGGAGQLGGNGGTPGDGGKAKPTYSALNDACAGGPGGKGGDGGRGGGGLGGHAIGIAHTGKAPPSDGVTIAKGTAGGGGKGDSAGGNVGDGASGIAAEVQAFP